MTSIVKGRFNKPIGYIEQYGRCIVKKVSNYGKKYLVQEGQVFWQFADIKKAREFAKGRYELSKLL